MLALQFHFATDLKDRVGLNAKTCILLIQFAHIHAVRLSYMMLTKTRDTFWATQISLTGIAVLVYSNNSITFAHISGIAICNSALFFFNMNFEMLGIHPRT